MKLHELELYQRTHDRVTIGFLAWWYPWAKSTLTPAPIVVDCEGCGAQCCRATDVYLLDGIDDPTHYQTEQRTDGRQHLLKRADGACIHLGADDRCTVHDTAPMMCHVFDCRVYSAARTVVIEPGTEEATLACQAGLTRFEVVPFTQTDRIAMAAAITEVRRLSMEMEAAAAVGAGLLLWPRRTGGPALNYLQTLERQASKLRVAVINDRQEVPR